LNSQSNS
jgi:hypothetical protein